MLNDTVKYVFCFLRTRNYSLYLRLWCWMILLGKLFIFFAQGKSPLSLWLWCSMLLLGKLFTFFTQEIILYISGCGVKWYCELSYLFSSHKKLYCISQVVLLNDILRKTFYFVRTRKFYSFSQVVVLSDVSKAFYFFSIWIYPVYFRLWC